MQPLKITIPGNYWDSLIYEGRLYLFTRDGGIKTINWDRLVSEWPLSEDLRLPLRCAFSRSDLLYRQEILRDREFKQLMLDKFERLRAVDLELSNDQLSKWLLGEQDNKFPFPHADVTIYRRTMFSAGQDGIYSGTCNKKTRKPVSTRPQRRTDLPALSIDASYNSLAIAAGDQGLYEFRLATDFNFEREPMAGETGLQAINGKQCIDCSWMFQSIYGSSHIEGGYLAAYSKHFEDANRRRFSRKLESIVAESEIFPAKSYSWGSYDKLCFTDR